MNRLSSIPQSFLALPRWVQVWVLLLSAVNAASFMLLDTVVGQATAAAAIFVVLTNGPLLAYYGGMNRALSIPHLFAWIPLSVFVVMHLWAQDAVPVSTTEFSFGITVLIVNGISLVFDVLDSWRWLKGERETPGLI